MEPITSPHVQADMIASQFGGYFGKAIRCAAYLLVAILLLQANSYPIEGQAYIALSIGALGLTSSSARIGQLGLAVLLLMALFPFGFISSLFN